MKANLALVHDRSAPPLTPDRLSDNTGEFRIRNVDLAERLGFENPLIVRKLIERSAGELRNYGDVSVTVAENADPKGRARPGKVSWLNEGQALVLCSLSRTPRAAAVHKQVIEVFLAYRAGRLATAPAPEPAGALLAETKAGLDTMRQDARALAEAATALLARVDQQERDFQAAAQNVAKRLAAPAPKLRVLPPAQPGPMLMGLDAIAAHLGITPRQAKYRADTGAIPTFKMSRAVCSSRAALDAFVAESVSTGRRA